MHFKTSSSEKELLQIIQLQKKNLPANLSEEEMRKNGFVTVCHSLHDLEKMNGYEHNIIAVDNDKVVAYLLAMTTHSRNDIPVLIPMFDAFNVIEFRSKAIAEYQYIVVGQVCVHKDYRGQGILDECYKTYCNHFKNKYAFAITEIAVDNLRSVAAHARIGFREVHRYAAPDQQEWSVVIWEW